MDDFYTLGQVARMTGLTTRTLRNYIAGGLLRGKKTDGSWRFTAEEIAEMIAQPAIRQSIQAKNKSVVYDFLAEEKKNANELCIILDSCVAQDEADAMMDFFCGLMKASAANMQFSFHYRRKTARVILKGPEDRVMAVLNAYYKNREERQKGRDKHDII